MASIDGNGAKAMCSESSFAPLLLKLYGAWEFPKLAVTPGLKPRTDVGHCWRLLFQEAP